jgi:hypothetical protein
VGTEALSGRIGSEAEIVGNVLLTTLTSTAGSWSCNAVLPCAEDKHTASKTNISLIPGTIFGLKFELEDRTRISNSMSRCDLLDAGYYCLESDLLKDTA